MTIYPLYSLVSNKFRDSGLKKDSPSLHFLDLYLNVIVSAFMNVFFGRRFCYSIWYMCSVIFRSTLLFLKSYLSGLLKK